MLNISFEYAYKPVEDSIADFCLQPVRYLCNGKTVSVRRCETKGEIFFERQEFPSFREKSLLKTVAAIIAFIPGLILGGILKAIASFDTSLKVNVLFYQSGNDVKKVEEAARPILIVQLLNYDPEVQAYASELRQRYGKKVQLEIQYGIRPVDLSRLSEKFDLHLLVIPEQVMNIFKDYSPLSQSVEEVLQSSRVHERRCVVVDYFHSKKLSSLNPKLTALDNLVLEYRY